VLDRYLTLLRRESRVSRRLAQRERWNLYDEVTGVYHRDSFLRRLEEALHLAERYPHPVALMVVDIVGLREVNQRWGPSVGDELLRQVALFLQETVRKVDLVGRSQEDEFFILLHHANAHQAASLGERLLSRLREREFVSIQTGQPIQVRFRLGIAASAQRPESPEDLIQRAYQALHEAKEEGRALHLYAPARTAPKTVRQRRVVVTGIGVISPIGIGKEAFWEAVREGKSGIRLITFFDASPFPTRIAGEVHGFEPKHDISPKELRRMARSSHLAIVATRMALEDAGLLRKEGDEKEWLMEPEERHRVAVVIGCAVGGLEYGEQEYAEMLLNDAKKVSPYLAINIFAGATSSEVSRHFGFKGPSITVSTGCSAANDAIGYALETIRNGEADLAVAGGAEAPLRPLILASFISIGATSRRNDEPEKASRPFDKLRDGFVMSEGAGILILEELQHALRRGAHIYGELIGYAATGDAYHMTRPAPDGEAAARAIQLALEDARIAPHEVDYINAHGSSTPLNDKIETAIIRRVFGKHAYNLAVSSTKSQVGHPIGASGGIELIATLLGMEHDMLPPTINYEVPDPECDLDYVPNRARPGRFEVAVSNSFGFGGKNSILVVRRY
jgi:3-oxoacyl-[acyl-carrier-protein] synthase II